MTVNAALLRWRKSEIPYALLRNGIIKFSSIFNPEMRKQMRIIGDNQRFRGILRGKRCFIIGNGPSLKKRDLSLLEDEIVFTCNSITQMEGFDKLKTNYHFWMDPNFFKGDDYVHHMKNIKTVNNSPVVFFPVEQKQFVCDHALDRELDIHYFKSAYTLYEGYNKDIDFCKILPLVTTVVMIEIYLAIYMGAKEIYLLGCDCTGAISHIRSLENNYVREMEYAYDMTDKERRLRQIAYEADGNEFFFYLQSKGFQHYRLLNNYCSKRGIKIVNCTAGGILNEIPRENFEDVINRK